MPGIPEEVQTAEDFEAATEEQQGQETTEQQTQETESVYATQQETHTDESTSQETTEETEQVEQSTEEASQQETQEQTSEETTSKEESTESDINHLEELEQITGLKFESMHDVVDNLKEYAEYKQDPYKALGISQRMKRAIEAEQSGVSPEKFFSVSRIDPDKMDQKELLRQEYMIDNPDDDDEARKFLNAEFEREYRKEYAILNDQRKEDDFETTEEWLQHQEEKRFAEQKLKYKADKAKSKISEWKQKSLEGEQQGPSQEEQEKMQREYDLETDRVIKNLKQIQVKVGENENYNIDLKNDDVKQVEGYLKDPKAFLKNIGIDVETKDIDQKKLSDHIARTLVGDTISQRIATHKVESANKKTVTTKRENPKQTKHTPNTSMAGLDDLAEAAAEHRRQQGY